MRFIAGADRVLIEIEDECGGLADGNAEALFQPFERRNADRTGSVSESRSADGAPT
jgi:signal transduction histidine kinase